jgi:hypothetical protein
MLSLPLNRMRAAGRRLGQQRVNASDYLIALIFSSMPLGHSFASSEAR